MKRIASTGYSEWAFNLAMLALRVVPGVMILIIHGLEKIQNFNTLAGSFYSFMGLGHRTSLVLAIFSEVFCSLFVILGLFTRLSVIPLLITMLVAIFGFNAGKPWGDSEMAYMYLVSYFVLLLCGPGKISVDGMMSK
jgi:putative oxidoreductase